MMGRVDGIALGHRRLENSSRGFASYHSGLTRVSDACRHQNYNGL